MNGLEKMKEMVLNETIKLSEMNASDDDIKVEINKSNAITNGAKVYLNALKTEIDLENAKRTARNFRG